MQELASQFRLEVGRAGEGMAFQFLPYRFEDLMSRPGSNVSGKQNIFKLGEQLGIDFLFARDQVLDLSRNLGARFVDGLLQTVQQRAALFGLFLVVVLFAKDG